MIILSPDDASVVGELTLGASIRASIGSWSVMPGAWPRKTPKKRSFSIESGTQS